MIEAWDPWISQLEGDSSLLEPARLRERIEVVDRLEAYSAWRFDKRDGEAPSVLAVLEARIDRLSVCLESANQRAYRLIRDAIRGGSGAQSVREWAAAVAPAGTPADGNGYDGLDVLLSGVLQIREPAAAAEPVAGMVFYQPTPARHIFELMDRAGLAEQDVLIDLGSGLGHVPLLAAICTGARCIGVEWQAAYVDCARRCATELGLANVTFLQQDVRAADLSAGTVFYLYTPFTGAMLDDVLSMLRREAAMRAIRICTLGPCTARVAQESWLESSNISAQGGVTVFRSKETAS